MFFWISRGVPEPYIPPARPEIVHPLHAVPPSKASKKIETEDKSERETVSKGFSEGASSEYKANSSLGEVRSKQGEFLSSLTARDLMSSPVVSFEENDPIERADEIFFQKGFRHVPVIKEESTLCGILSDRDWMRWQLTRGKEVGLAKTIGDIMKTKVLSVQMYAGIGEISKVLFEERIGCLPVVNEQTQVIGMITRSDVLRAILKVNEREFLA
ncbi:CBS domain-containing protein [Leptospira sp. 201903070]|uniref:CBS domain-containing protein n=1 Tax=Leptospira ainlahdjerensis TaxID=2810033 RepID=A0ABS2UGS3_9LEPT|nr:CBS domain-containing protein [Leptospira ainlahdjerensis]MBM9579354.1 CBS domain-containing protein [Leptospira ainlahdjerensis]